MKKNMVALMFSVIGGIVAILSGYYQWLEKNAETLKAENAQKKADSAHVETTKAQKELIELQKVLLSKTNELALMQTGGDSKPFLLLNIGPYEKDAFIIMFQISNKGTYPLHFVNCRISDVNSLLCYRSGIRKSISYALGSESRPATQYEIDNYKMENKFELQTLLNKNPQHLYSAIFSTKACMSDKVVYPVDLEWNNGHLRFFIHLKVSEGKLLLENTSEATLNNERVDFKEYFGVKFMDHWIKAK